MKLKNILKAKSASDSETKIITIEKTGIDSRMDAAKSLPYKITIRGSLNINWKKCQKSDLAISRPMVMNANPKKPTMTTAMIEDETMFFLTISSFFSSPIRSKISLKRRVFWFLFSIATSHKYA